MAQSAVSEERFIEVPRLPEGRTVELPRRGRTFIREVAAAVNRGSGPAGHRSNPSVTFLLLHGWTVTTDMNFHRVMCDLADQTGARVIGMDQRGHGRGIRPKALFRLEDCADDVGALITELDLKNVIVVGYSMGGAIAQLVAKRHPDLIAGAIFCATTCVFGPEVKQPFGIRDIVGPAMATGLTVMPPAARRALLARVLTVRRSELVPEWMREEIRRSDPAMIAQAGVAIGRFDARPWIGTLTMPTAVVKTLRDETVSPRRQQLLIDGLTNVTVHECDADHRAAVTQPVLFLEALVAAINSVTRNQSQTGDFASSNPVG